MSIVLVKIGVVFFFFFVFPSRSLMTRGRKREYHAIDCLPLSDFNQNLDVQLSPTCLILLVFRSLTHQTLDRQKTPRRFFFFFFFATLFSQSFSSCTSSIEARYQSVWTCIFVQQQSHCRRMKKLEERTPSSFVKNARTAKKETEDDAWCTRVIRYF